MSSHKEDSLLRQISTFIAQETLLSPASRPLLAVSGGRDSMALTSIFLRLNRWPLAIAHFNFQLRGEESERDHRYVEQFCRKAKITLHVRREDAETWCRIHKRSLEDGCRELRYDFFKSLCDQYGYTEIVTAHHADDQAETLLFHLSRGCGLEGIRGMRPRNGKVIRPLLPFPRRVLEAWLSTNAIEYVDDSSNETDDYTRNYIRHKVLPALSAVNRQTVQHLYALSRYADEAYVTLRTEAEAIWGEIESTQNSTFDPQSTAVVEHKRLATFWLRERLQYLQFSTSAIDTVFYLLTNGQTGKRLLAKNWEVFIERGKLNLVARTSIPDTLYYLDKESSDAHLRFSETIISESLNTIELKQYANKGKSIALFDADLINFPLCYRVWQAGDVMRPLGMPNGQKKKVSDILTDAHYPTSLRRSVRILVDSCGRILWIPSVRQSAEAALSSTTHHVLEIAALEGVI